MRRLSFLTLLFLVGCTHHVRIDNPFLRPADRHSRWVNGFLWNLVGGDVSTAEFCGNRPAARIDTKRSFGNAFISWLTFGIYTPMHVTVTCAAHPDPAYGLQPGFVPPQPYGMPPAYAMPPGGAPPPYLPPPSL
jgi:hypothetical protein